MIIYCSQSDKGTIFALSPDDKKKQLAFEHSLTNLTFCLFILSLLPHGSLPVPRGVAHGTDALLPPPPLPSASSSPPNGSPPDPTGVPHGTGGHLALQQQPVTINV